MKKNAIQMFMLTGLFILLTGLVACGGDSSKGKATKWEYRTVTLAGYAEDEFSAKVTIPDSTEMNQLGEEGWELVSAYELLETTHPNYGNEKYVTGLQANVRTGGVVFIYKRPKQEANSKGTDKSKK